MCSCSGVDTITAVTSGSRDHVLVAAGVTVGAGLFGERPRAARVLVGDREVTDRRMLGREPRPQCPDAPGTDDGDADIALLHATRLGATSRR